MSWILYMLTLLAPRKCGKLCSMKPCWKDASSRCHIYRLSKASRLIPPRLSIDMVPVNLFWTISTIIWFSPEWIFQKLLEGMPDNEDDLDFHKNLSFGNITWSIHNSFTTDFVLINGRQAGPNARMSVDEPIHKQDWLIRISVHINKLNLTVPSARLLTVVLDIIGLCICDATVWFKCRSFTAAALFRVTATVVLWAAICRSQKIGKHPDQQNPYVRHTSADDADLLFNSRPCANRYIVP